MLDIYAIIKDIEDTIKEELKRPDVNWEIIDGLYQDLENAKEDARQQELEEELKQEYY